MNNSFKILLLVLAFVVAALTTVEARAASGTIDVKEIYRFYCAQCHGSEGKGDGINDLPEMPVSPRDHTSRSEMSKLTDDEIISVIKEGGEATGKSTVMPPFGKTLNEDEIEALRAYLRELCDC